MAFPLGVVIVPNGPAPFLGLDVRVGAGQRSSKASRACFHPPILYIQHERPPSSFYFICIVGATNELQGCVCCAAASLVLWLVKFGPILLQVGWRGIRVSPSLSPSPNWNWPRSFLLAKNTVCLDSSFKGRKKRESTAVVESCCLFAASCPTNRRVQLELFLRESQRMHARSRGGFPRADSHFIMWLSGD